MSKQKKIVNESGIAQERKNINRLKSIKSDFIAGNIKSFQEIYDVVAISWIAKKLGMGFTTLKEKSNSPGDFSLNEIKRYSELLGIDFEELLSFVKHLMLHGSKLTKK